MGKERKRKTSIRITDMLAVCGLKTRQATPKVLVECNMKVKTATPWNETGIKKNCTPESVRLSKLGS